MNIKELIEDHDGDSLSDIVEMILIDLEEDVDPDLKVAAMRYDLARQDLIAYLKILGFKSVGE